MFPTSQTELFLESQHSRSRGYQGPGDGGQSATGRSREERIPGQEFRIIKDLKMDVLHKLKVIVSDIIDDIIDEATDDDDEKKQAS